MNIQDLKFFLDIGAKLSYIDSNLTLKHTIIGYKKVYYPSIGTFETESYEILANLEGDEFPWCTYS